MRRLKKWSIEEIMQYQSFIDSKYILLSNIYTRNRDHLHFVCPEGHDHFATWTKFLVGKRCAKCFGNKLMNIEEIKNALQNEGYKLVDTKYKSCMDSMKMICPKNHIWISSWNNFQSGYRCLECSGVKQITFEMVEKEATARGYRVENRSVVINKSTKLNFICPKGHYFITHWDSFRIHGCSNLECVEEKKRQTNIKLFGVVNTSMLKEFQDKQARSANNKTIKNHWFIFYFIVI